jgi:alkanesulfonate monooxygenase SsuD/methylene tetrahydromethanopterin reductase-like flavin-dependent oxidoreductase (luciferase family)
MAIDVGMEPREVSYDTDAEVAAEAARLGYGHIWTGGGGDPFQTCALRWAASRSARPGGIGTAIGIVPVGQRPPADIATSAAALTRLTAGRFVLGIGSGNIDQVAYRRTWGITERSPLALVRAYLTTLRGFLHGEPVTHHGSGIDYEDARLPGEPPRTPIYVGGFGPEMARLTGELADGLYLSWCTADLVESARAHLAEGADRAGRDPASVALAASVRVSVDDDTEAARRALAGALLPYVIGWPGAAPARPFRAAFDRMGFGAEIAELDRMVERGASREEIAGSFPERMLRGLGYAGPADGAPEALRRIAGSADTVVVRIVPARPGIESIRAILEACRPEGNGA